jgi:hypothetical protein
VVPLLPYYEIVEEKGPRLVIFELAVVGSPFFWLIAVLEPTNLLLLSNTFFKRGFSIAFLGSTVAKLFF